MRALTITVCTVAGALWVAYLGEPKLAAVLAVVAIVGWSYRHLSLQPNDRLLRLRPEQLDELTGAEFEDWATAKLAAGGFSVTATAKTRDFGVDIIAEHRGRRFGVQAKKRKGKNIGNAAVQQANAGCDYYDCEIAVVVTQARFTKAALSQAAHLNRPCVLIGRDELDDMTKLLLTATESR